MKHLKGLLASIGLCRLLAILSCALGNKAPSYRIFVLLTQFTKLLKEFRRRPIDQMAVSHFNSYSTRHFRRRIGQMRGEN